MSTHRFASPLASKASWDRKPWQSHTQLPPGMSGTTDTLDPNRSSSWLGTYAEKMVAAQGDPERLKRAFDQSSVPMVMVDGDRRHVHANTAARLAFRQSLAELRRLRIDDLTPRYFWPVMEKAWMTLNTDGHVSGTYDVASPAGTSMRVVYYAMAHALPGLHFIAFVPAGWPREELLGGHEARGSDEFVRLTRRELEVLQLAADGFSSPMIARELFVAVATVKTHLGNIYDKLQVRDRAAAVAKAMRLGLIS